MFILKFIVLCIILYAFIGSMWDRTRYQREEFLDWIEEIKEWYNRKH